MTDAAKVAALAEALQPGVDPTDGGGEMSREQAAEARWECVWCGAKLAPIDGVWTDEITGSGDYCEEGLAVGATGTSPHLPSLPGVLHGTAHTHEKDGSIRWLTPAALRSDATPERETAWLIERGQPQNHAPTVWLVERPSGLPSWTTEAPYRWTETASKATRYPSKEAAEAFMAEHSGYVASQRFIGRATEHVFLSATPETPEAAPSSETRCGDCTHFPDDHVSADGSCVAPGCWCVAFVEGASDD